MKKDENEDAQMREMFGLSREALEPRSEIKNLWLDFFVSSAVAANKLSPEMTDKLNNWVPKKHELNRYLPMVRTVLAAVSQRQLGAKKLKNVLTPAWMNVINKFLGIILICFGTLFILDGINDMYHIM
mgnify:CR=1 FL=1